MCSLTLIRMAAEKERVDGFIESALLLIMYDLTGEDDLEEFVDAAFSSLDFKIEIKV